MLLSAVLKNKGHRVDILIGSPEKVIKDLEEAEADIIAFSMLTLERNYVFQTIHEIRKHNFKQPVLLGGIDATLSPEELLSNQEVDFVCVGEGETAILKFAESIDKGLDPAHINSIWSRSNTGQIIKNDLFPLIDDLDQVPFPDRSIYQEKNAFFRLFPMQIFFAGRGCLYSCSYCFNHKFSVQTAQSPKTKYLRVRTVDNCIEELSIIKREYSSKNIYFCDSSMLSFDEKWLNEFFIKYAQLIELPFSINACANEINTENAKLLKESGCYSVRIGLETGNEKFRREILKKNISNETYFRAAGILKKQNIPVMWNYIIGFPGETLENSYETIEVMQKLYSDNRNPGSFFVPYPNISITEEASAKGLVMPDYKNLFFRIDNSRESILNSPDIPEKRKLYLLSTVAIAWPAAFPFIKWCIKLPLSPLYKLVNLFMMFRMKSGKAKGFNLNFVLQYIFLNGFRFV